MSVLRTLICAMIIVAFATSATRPADDVDAIAETPRAEGAAQTEKELRLLIASLQDQVSALSMRVAQLEGQTVYSRPALRPPATPRPSTSTPRAWGRGEINGQAFYISPMSGEH